MEFNPTGLAVAPDGKHVYVANHGTGSGTTLSVIDTTTNNVVATVTGLSGPYGVAVTPDGKHVYVANNGSSSNGTTVSVIDTKTNTVVGTVTVGTYPQDVAVTPDGTHAYETNFTSGTVSVIATATNTVVATVPVGSNPWGIAITPDGQHAYVTNTGSGNVSEIATTTNTVVATIAVGSYPVAVGIGSPPPAPCGSGDAALVNIKFPTPGTVTFDISSPTRTLQSITLLSSSNIGSFTLPAVVSGGHSATGGVFTKANSAISATFDLKASFVSPAFACSIDPLTTTLKINSGHKVVQAFQMIPDSEHFIEIDNGNPGLRWLRIEVNGEYDRTLSLISGRTVYVDLSAAMNLGQNTLTFTGEGKTGSFANINVSDSVPYKPTLPRAHEAGIWGHLMFEKEVP